MGDVVIVGGALTGCSTAYHLLVRDPSLSVAVIERDPSYELAASARSNAMVRQTFSQPENLLMSRYGQRFYGDFPELMAIDGERPPLHYERGGLLVIGNDEAQAEDIRVNTAFQRSMGCEMELLDATALAGRWPALETADTTLSAFSADAGWIDPNAALHGLRRKARALGASFVQGDVVGIDAAGGRADTVRLADGGSLRGRWIVDAAGAWAGGIARLLDIEIPVVPLPRMVFYFETQHEPPVLPYIRDGFGIGFRREGRGFLSGVTDFSLAGDFGWDVRHEWFEERVWPGLAHRVPAFEQIKVKNAWVGHYAQCLLDGNMLIGPWPGAPDNFLLATGYSGHGLQHAPAVGRALAELVLDGRYVSIDLAALGCERAVAGRAYPERGWRA